MSKEKESTRNKNVVETLGRAVLFLAGSAVFGSIALVIWNRRALSSLREAADKPAELANVRDDEGIY